MSKEFLATNHSGADFTFVYDLDENSLDVFFGVVDMSIAAMKESLEEDALRDNAYLKGLTPTQLQEILTYYNKLLDLYTDFELFEECEGIVQIIDTLEVFARSGEKNSC